MTIVTEYSSIRKFLLSRGHHARCDRFLPDTGDKQPCTCGFDEADVQLAVMELKVKSVLVYEFIPMTIGENGKAVGDITIKRHIQRDGTEKWAVYLRDMQILDDEGDWILEPIPSSRTDAHIAATCFDFEEAWGRALQAASKEMEKGKL